MKQKEKGCNGMEEGTLLPRLLVIQDYKKEEVDKYLKNSRS
jgi:hypothetical protein